MNLLSPPRRRSTPATALKSVLRVQLVHRVSGHRVSTRAAVVFQVTWTNPRRAAERQREIQHRGEIVEERVQPREALAQTICKVETGEKHKPQPLDSLEDSDSLRLAGGAKSD